MTGTGTAPETAEVSALSNPSFVPSARARPYARICESRMAEESREEIIEKFGKRVQRCYGCLIAFHLKDMFLGEDVTWCCENCRDDSMFHFEDFSKLIDISKLREVSEDDHHH